jgi:hypothetical protein
MQINLRTTGISDTKILKPCGQKEAVTENIKTLQRKKGSSGPNYKKP